MGRPREHWTLKQLIAHLSKLEKEVGDVKVLPFNGSTFRIVCDPELDGGPNGPYVYIDN